MRGQIPIVSITALVILLGACQAVSAAPSPVGTMSIWIPGGGGFLSYASSAPVYMDHYGYFSDIGIPASGSVIIDFPLTVPSKINADRGRTNTVYLYWDAPTDCYIQRWAVGSGPNSIGYVDTNIPGTGSLAPVTVNIGSTLICRQGLSISWVIGNSGGTTQNVRIQGCGAKIRY